MSDLSSLRSEIRVLHLHDEDQLLLKLQQEAAISPSLRHAACARATALVTALREDEAPGLMEVFLAEYGLSTEEGIALMCLAEALLRVPDAETIDALIEDKIAPSAWGKHLGKSNSSLVNASTWALMLTGNMLRDGRGMAQVLRGALRRLGEPVIRTAVRQAMKEMGRQFVLGQTIDDAIARGNKMVARGYRYSYDMLGEAALTARDAEGYFAAYAGAIARLAAECTHDDIRENPGISVKLSALHPRYEEGQRARVMAELVPRLVALARQARAAGLGLNVDAEEADRLDLSLDVIEAALGDETLAGWDGFGVVIQAYGKRASAVIDWVQALAAAQDRQIMVRLVKGAYWDTEIKRAQVEGLDGFPVFTRKCATDVAYLCGAKRLLECANLYPQFATHNAHTIAAILEMGADPASYEFQRLHGMGEALHDMVLRNEGTRCRIYAPVGAHRDLLAYLVRRLLENGANSSFVNQIVDEDVPAATVAADPFAALEGAGKNAAVIAPQALFGARANSRGFDLHNRTDLAQIEAARAPFANATWQAAPRIAGKAAGGAQQAPVSPYDPADRLGQVTLASAQDCKAALAAAAPWDAPVSDRAMILLRAADLYEQNFGEIFALLSREAGKTPADAIAELREAVDFLRYYADQARALDAPALGLVTCISPWNFPLAIFTGQIAAALAAGNGVLAKPAEATPLIADLAVRLLHDAGVPASALQLLPGAGSVVGAALTQSPAINAVCFTGSTHTAQVIHRAMADHLPPSAPLIAETGGLNAMVVDSTALPEQAVRDIVMSAFRSAGQRCSALRMLYVQQDVAAPFLAMLQGAMEALVLGDPWDHATDVGPVIDEAARAKIKAYVDAARGEGRVIAERDAPAQGYFIGPAVLRVNGIEDLGEEIFGPVLHVATFPAEGLNDVIEAVNGAGYGLTFGIHTRIDDRVEAVTEKLKVGNIYVNRNQIGAIVGSQPFGGEGLSGTGPKAGGPRYVPRFARGSARATLAQVDGPYVDRAHVQKLLHDLAAPQTYLGTEQLAGPTGESNRLSTYGRGTVLCLGPTLEAARQQALTAQANGCRALVVALGGAADGLLDPADLQHLEGVDLVVHWGDAASLRPIRQALAARKGAIVTLASAADDLAARCVIERHICVDTTAAGGNASLLAKAS